MATGVIKRYFDGRNYKNGNKYIGVWSCIENYVEGINQQQIYFLIQHIPPARLHYIRYYGLYSSRTRSRWKDIPHIVNLAPECWKLKHKLKDDDYSPPDSAYDDNSVFAKAKRSAKGLDL